MDEAKRSQQTENFLEWLGVMTVIVMACVTFWAYAIRGFWDVWGAQIHKIFSGVWQ